MISKNKKNILIVIALFIFFFTLSPRAQAEETIPNCIGADFAQQMQGKIKLSIPIPRVGERLYCLDENNEVKEVAVVNNMAEYFSAFYIFFVGVVGIFAVLAISYGGFIWLTAMGNETRITNAKAYINGAAIGVIITMVSYIFLQLINPELVNFRIVQLMNIQEVIQRAYSCEASGPAAQAAGKNQECGTAVFYTDIDGKEKTCMATKCTTGLCSKEKRKCIPLDEECVNTDKTECADTDQRIRNSGNLVKGCGTLYNFDNEPQGCVYDTLIGCDVSIVPMGSVQHQKVRCNTGGGVETNCWDAGEGGPKYKDHRTYTGPIAHHHVNWCTFDERAVKKTASICCAKNVKKEINCQANQPGKDIEVDCGPYNAIAGQEYEKGGVNCGSKCWMELYLKNN